MPVRVSWALPPLNRAAETTFDVVKDHALILGKPDVVPHVGGRIGRAFVLDGG